MSEKFKFVTEAVLLLDYIRSSGLTAILGDVAAARRKSDLERLVLAAASKFDVQRTPKDTGDGFFMTFKSETDATSCGIAILQHLVFLNKGVPREELEIHLRIGITFGELVVDDKEERKGEAANLCARYENLSPEDLLEVDPGISPSAFEDLRRDRILVTGEVNFGIKQSFPVKYVGLMKPKDIPRRYEVYVVDWRSAERIEIPQFSDNALNFGGAPKPIFRSEGQTNEAPARSEAVQTSNRTRPVALRTSAIDPDALTGLVFQANEHGAFATDLIQSDGSLLDLDLNEGLILVKPGGTFHRLCLREIFQRILGSCTVVQVRVFDGHTVKQQALFDKQYRTSTQIATGELPLNETDYANIRAIYDTPKFHRTFGCAYTDELVTPALALCEKIGLSEAELTSKWDQGREKHLFHNRLHDGLNKIGFQKSVYPIRFSEGPGSPVRIVLNGFIPGYRLLFTQTAARVVALHVCTKRPWSIIRDDLVGGDSDPAKCKSGSIRYDSLQKKISLDPRDALVNGQRNVCHSSATLIDGVNELRIWHGLEPGTTVLGRVCKAEGVPTTELAQFIDNSLWTISWTRIDVINRLIFEVQHSRIKDELRAAAAERRRLIAKYASICDLHPNQIEGSHEFRGFMENGLRLTVSKVAYFQHLCARCLPELTEKHLFYEVVGEINELSERRDPPPSQAVLAEACRIAASDIRFLGCPAYSSEIQHTELFKTHVVHELARSALDCATRTELNLLKDTKAGDQRSNSPRFDHAIVTIGETSDWRTFLDSKRETINPQTGILGIVLCGGRSTRMASTIPKPCLPLGRKLMLTVVSEMLKEAAGPEKIEVFAAVGYRADLLKRAFGNGIRYLEYAPTLGLGFRVATCLHAVASYEGVVVLSYVDMPLLSYWSVRELVTKVQGNKKSFGLLVANQVSGLSGHVVRNERGEITRIDQERLRPQATAKYQERDAGLYVFHNTQALRDALLHVSNGNIRGEFMFADVVAQLVSRGFEIIPVEENPESALGINTAADLLRVAAGLRKGLRPEIGDIRSSLIRDYRLQIDDGLDAAVIDTAVEHHTGPFYFLHWWEKAWP